MYTKEEVLAASRKYFSGDELAATVFTTKYALTDKYGAIWENTPDGMHQRLAKEFARIERKYPNPMNESEIFRLLSSWEVVPQGSPMSGIGNDHQLQSLSNCFVIGAPEDSYAGILHTDQQQVQIMKRRGGVGFDISNLRPKGMVTSNAARTTDGLAIFMERFSNSTREVAQGGRRGALMISIDIRHPEIETFINIKRNLDKVTGANISIRLTDEFMLAAASNKNYTQQWPVDSANPECAKSVSARKIWDMIIDSAWTMAEPGVLFWDNVIKSSIPDCYADLGFKTESCNPCAELVLCRDDSCRLLLINLAKFIKGAFTGNARFEWDRFSKVVQQSQRLMDDLIDLEIESVDKIIAKIKADPEDESVKAIELDLWERIKKKALLGRRTGLGVTAVGDAVAMLGVKYGSNKSIKVIGEIYKALGVNAHISSCKLAKERGAFPIFDAARETDLPYLVRLLASNKELASLYKKYGRRNIALTTTAPAGSVSTMTQTTSGIEPVFMLKYRRRRKITHGENLKADFVDAMGDEWVEYDVYHHMLKKWMDVTGDDNIENSPYWGATAPELDWVQRVKIQAEAQKWVDHGISSTCNLPADVSKETVRKIYEAAWKSGCKGFTVYRDGCRTGVLVSADDKNDSAHKDDFFPAVSAPKRPDSLECEIRHASIKGEKWVILVGMYKGRPYELMAGLSSSIEIPGKYKTGQIIKRPRKTKNSIYDLSFGEEGSQIVIKDIVKMFDNPLHAAFTRTISLALRHGADVKYIVEQLNKSGEIDFTSFNKVVSRILKKYIQDGEVVSGSKECDACGDNALVYQEGCVTCSSCGNSKC